MEVEASLKLEESVSFDATDESCTISTRNGAAHQPQDDCPPDGCPPAGDSQSEAPHEQEADATMLLHSSEKKPRLQYLCPRCYSLYRSYRSPAADPHERVTPFALVLLSVLCLVYVLNQADRLMLPVVIPSGLRCETAGESECANSSSSSSSSDASPMANASEGQGVDCIHFSDDQQGLLTGACTCARLLGSCTSFAVA